MLKEAEEGRRAVGMSNRFSCRYFWFFFFSIETAVRLSLLKRPCIRVSCKMLTYTWAEMVAVDTAMPKVERKRLSLDKLPPQDPP